MCTRGDKLQRNVRFQPALLRSVPLLLVLVVPCVAQSKPDTPACRKCSAWATPVDWACYTRKYCSTADPCDECSKSWCESKLGKKLSCGTPAATTSPNIKAEQTGLDMTSGVQVTEVVSEEGQTTQGSSVSAFTYEPDTMRRGSDYRNFALTAPNAALCQEACAAESRCKAYSYVKPNAGSHGASPWCYLKDAVPDVAGNSCCIGGVRRAAQ